MDYYNNIYTKRLNRFGKTTTSRLENSRRAQFEHFLSSSPHRVEFEYNNEIREGVLEPQRLTQARVTMHLLCRVGDDYNSGDVVEIDNEKYMFYYWDERRNSGYNRWAMVRMSHFITWEKNDKIYSSYALLTFQEHNMLKNELRSRSRSASVYSENLKLNFLLMPTNINLEIGDYLEITTTGAKQSFVVTGYDLVSTPGVMYVSMDPTYERDLSPMPEQTEEDEDESFFWFRGE